MSGRGAKWFPGFRFKFQHYWVTQAIKNLPAMQETRVRKIPRRREWQPSPLFLPGKLHGQRSLAGYSPWGRKQLDMTEYAHIFTMLYITFDKSREIAE